ncbi:MAG: hypothetical protein AAFN59_01025 [Pseudomonadota bacterium]
MKKIAFPALCLCVLVACETGPYLSEVPEEVAALVGPNQNLERITLLEEDGCYWYEHTNAVETTLLPLLSTRGRHICTQPADA